MHQAGAGTGRELPADETIMSRTGTDDQRWKVLETREVYSAIPWLSVERQRVQLPSGKVIDDYHRVRLPDAVIIHAQTDDGLVVVERQYRHGLGSVTLALPAGTIEPGEGPLEAAKRELLEETGYSAPIWKSIGTFVANGNYGCGRIHVFSARSAIAVSQPGSDDLEQGEVVLLPQTQLLAMVYMADVELLSSAAAVALVAGAER